jgi:D-amino-acid oxidase
MVCVRVQVRVVVLGAGIVGLTAAVRLLEAGARVEVVAAGGPETTTSWLAAAVWYPTHVGPPADVARWGRGTYQMLARQAADGVPGVRMLESLALYRRPPEHAPWMDAVGAIRPAHTGELPPGYAHGLRFAVPLVEMPLHLPWLAGVVERLGGRLLRQRVRSLSELCGPDVDVLVNCSGLAARELAGDSSVVPVRGQIVRVTNPGLTLSVRDEEHPLGRAYVHPRAHDCVLGGTLDVGREDIDPDPAVAESIMQRCRDLVPELAAAEVIEHVVGLRPGRPTVRLEEGERDPSGTRIVHDYGHGGAGITLAWACADDVVRLVLDGAETAGRPGRTRGHR